MLSASGGQEESWIGLDHGAKFLPATALPIWSGWQIRTKVSASTISPVDAIAQGGGVKIYSRSGKGTDNRASRGQKPDASRTWGARVTPLHRTLDQSTAVPVLIAEQDEEKKRGDSLEKQMIRSTIQDLSILRIGVRSSVTTGCSTGRNQRGISGSHASIRLFE